jgi:hypothetical protein
MSATSIRYPSILLACLLFIAAAAVAVTVNILLLARTSDQSGPVVLAPRMRLPAAPAWTILPARGRIGDRGADD